MAAASQETYNNIKNDGLAKPSTPNETQDTSGIRLCYAWKGHKTRSSIYERTLPDKLTTALCIDGPSGTDNAMTFHNDGRITLMTGARDPNKGAASGRLNITTFGGLHKHEARVNMEFHEGDNQKPQGDGQALNIICYGDYIDEAKGSERIIKANIIRIEAVEELVLAGGSIKIQSQSDIEMAATAINSAQINKKDIILGQKMSFGAGEETSVQFDPRSNQAVVSPGHISHVIAGDYKQYIGGVSNITAAGGVFAVPLVKDRSSSYSVKSVLGNISTTAVAGATIMNSGAAFTATAGAAATIAAGGTFTATSTGDMTLAGAAVSVTGGAAVGITGGADVSITGANVRITGALIYLN